MKRIVAFIVAIILFIGTIVGYNSYLNNKLIRSKNKLYYGLTFDKFNCMEAAKICLNSEESDNILVLGSSELSAFNQDIFNQGNSDFNMYLVGQGYTQCLQSALSLGAIEEETGINKAVLIISPQWFESNNGIETVFSSRFQKGTFRYFLENEKISKETKTMVINRLKVLEKNDPLQLEKIERYEKAYLKNDFVERISLAISDNIEITKQKRKLGKIYENYQKTDSEKVKFSNLNFENLLNDATQKAEKLCTNNDFVIYDSYYDTYIRKGIDKSKNSQTNRKFSNEQEFEDFNIFLRVCQELGIQPLIVSVPVNGRWYDYIGISQEKREAYYKKINDMVLEHDAKIADFSTCEYEEYFLKDIMHLGLRGWLKVDEAIYQYYQEK